MAGHCSYCSYGLPSAVELATPSIGVDGVVVMALVDNGQGVGDPRWDIVTVAVRDASGVEVEGELETHPGFRPAAWRPAEPWSPGNYEVTIDVDLMAFEDPFGEPSDCSPYSVSYALTVSEQASHELGARSIGATQTYQLLESRDLDTLVCCGEALPHFESPAGIFCPGSPTSQLAGDWGCVSILGTGRLDLRAELLLDGVPAPADYAMREVVSGAYGERSGPVVLMKIFAEGCRTFEALDLVTGEQSSHELCFDSDEAEPLGSVELDATASLSEDCSGPAFVCSVEGSSWNPDACRTWPESEPFVHPSTIPASEMGPQDDNGGGSCRAGPGRPPVWIMLVALGISRTRRQRARRSTEPMNRT